MERIRHQITHSEIKFGIIAIRKTDGTSKFFSECPERFTVILKKNKLYARYASSKAIWMGYEAMRKLNPNDVVTIYRKGDTVIIE